MNIDQKFESKYAAKYLTATLNGSSFQTADSIQAIFWNPQTDFRLGYINPKRELLLPKQSRMKNGRRIQRCWWFTSEGGPVRLFASRRIASEKTRHREEKNSGISSCLVDKHANNTIWGETRIQSSQKTWKKTQRTKRPFISQRFFSKRRPAFLTAVYPVASAEGIPPTFISHAHFVPNCILRETDADPELETFGTALSRWCIALVLVKEHPAGCPSLLPPSGSSVTVRSRRARDNTCSVC